MKEVSINKQAKLSEHFTLGELTKTSYHPLDGNIPSHVAIENLRNLCENWLEDLRYSYNTLYGGGTQGGTQGTGTLCSAGSAQMFQSPCAAQMFQSPCAVSPCAAEESEEIPVVITSGYRSEEVNRLCGGAKGSNHLTGCAVDIRCAGPEQLIRYSSILLDMADGTRREFDELIHEKRGSTYWLHFAVRPPSQQNRRKILFDMH